MGLISRVSSRTYRNMFRSYLRPILRCRQSKIRTLAATRRSPPVLNPNLRYLSVDTQTEPVKITPKYQIQFTCNVCQHRSSHTFGKKSYHETVVICRCPKCNNHHVI